MSTTATPTAQPDRTPCRGALRDLIALAERYAAAADQGGLDIIRAEAERIADTEPADSLAAQVAGYIGLLTEDTEHALAEETHTWSRALHRALDTHCDGGLDGAVPAARGSRETGVRS